MLGKTRRLLIFTSYSFFLVRVQLIVLLLCRARYFRLHIDIIFDLDSLLKEYSNHLSPAGELSLNSSPDGFHYLLSLIFK